jgi:hypothetical protein
MSDPIKPTKPIQPVQRDESSYDPRFHAPPWVRNRPPPNSGQPQHSSSPSIASADTPTGGPPQHSEPPRMPSGPNVSWSPKTPSHEAFSGDLANQSLRRRLALEPGVVPPPPIVIQRDPRWIAGLGYVCLTAGIAAFCFTALFMNRYPPTSNTGDRLSSTTRSNDTVGLAPARLVAERGPATASDPIPLGVSLKDSSRCIWRVSGRELGVDYVGAMQAAVNLHALHAANNVVIDTQVVGLGRAPKVEPSTSPVPPVVAPSSHQHAQPLEPDEIGRLMKLGQQLLKVGDIAAARLMLRRAALAGSPDAALALGGTYDPEVLREIGAIGFAAIPPLANEWYQKALELGAGEAARRLERLAQGQR